MSQHNVKLLRYGHGYFGGGVFETCVMPALSHSAFAANNFVMEEEQYMIQQVGDRGADKYSANGESAFCVASNPMSDRGQMVAEAGGDEPLRVPQATKEGYAECPAGGAFDAQYPNSANRRGRVQEGGEITGALTTDSQWMVYEGTERVIQVGNTTPTAGVTTRENPNRGRAYSPEGRTSENVPYSEDVLRPKTDGIADTLTSMAGNRERMVAEPQIVGYSRDAKGAVVGYHLKDTANTVTTFTGSGHNTDQYAAEPQIESVGNIYPSGGQGGKVVNPEGIAPAMCECHGEVTRITEGMVFRSMQERGLDSPADIGQPATAVCAAYGMGGGQTAMAVESTKVSCQYQGEDADKAVQAAAELGELVAGKKEGEKIAVDVTKDGTLRPHLDNGSNYGLMDYYASHTDSVAGTQIAARPQQAYGPQTRYRIRKLTPRECFRLMDVAEADIDALLATKDEKGRPLLSKSALYKLAGNSIVESCLYFLFDKMFIHTEPTKPEIPTLF